MRWRTFGKRYEAIGFQLRGRTTLNLVITRAGQARLMFVATRHEGNMGLFEATSAHVLLQVLALVTHDRAMLF